MSEFSFTWHLHQPPLDKQWPCPIWNNEKGIRILIKLKYCPPIIIEIFLWQHIMLKSLVYQYKCEYQLLWTHHKVAFITVIFVCKYWWLTSVSNQTRIQFPLFPFAPKSQQRVTHVSLMCSWIFIILIIGWNLSLYPYIGHFQLNHLFMVSMGLWKVTWLN